MYLRYISIRIENSKKFSNIFRILFEYIFIFFKKSALSLILSPILRKSIFKIFLLISKYFSFLELTFYASDGPILIDNVVQNF